MRTLLILLLAACGGTSTPGPEGEVEVSSGGPTTPTVNRSVGRVSVDELKAKMDAGETLHIVDVRTASEVASGHVPGAIMMPLSDYTPTAPPVSTTDKKTPIYFVCESGGRSQRAAEATAAAGFLAVNVEGGTSAWRSAGYPLTVPGAE